MTPSVKRRKSNASPSVPITSTLVVEPLSQKKKASDEPAPEAMNGDGETQTVAPATPKPVKKKSKAARKAQKAAKKAAAESTEAQTTDEQQPQTTQQDAPQNSSKEAFLEARKERRKKLKMEHAKAAAAAAGTTEVRTIEPPKKQKPKTSYEGSAIKKFKSKLNDLQGRWKISSTLGGTYSELPPVFSQDEKYLLIARENTILVYSTKTSLLLRTITLPASKTTLVYFALNPHNPTEIIVAMQNGKVYLVDWEEDDVVREWTLDSKQIDKAVLAPIEEELDTDAIAIIYVTYGDALDRVSLLKRKTTYDSDSGVESDADLLTIVLRSFAQPVTGISVVDKGRVIVTITDRQVHIGWRREQKVSAPAKKLEKYAKWITLTVPTGTITCFTVAANYQQGLDKKQPPRFVGSVAVGSADGAIFLWSNLLDKYDDAQEASVKPPQKLHWHRRRVRAITASQDGNYIISGGEESVLVMWQLETSSKSFLPYLSGSIEDVIVSPQGTSYGIRLSDNSIMVLSIAELKPKASIVGLQTKGYSEHSSAVPFVVHPTQANKLLLVAPTSEDAAISEATKVAPAPFLQTYDTFSDRAVGRQALARNNVTVKAFGPGDVKLLEPDIKHLAISADGNWLASVDTWTPPARDLQSPAVEEIYLKFWKWAEARKQWELVARIDGPHPSEEDVAPEQVVDLIPLPKSAGFITLGSDGTARIWKPRSRVRGNVTVRQNEKDKNPGAVMETWGCRRIIRVSLPQTRSDKKRTEGILAISKDESLLAIAYPELSTLKDNVQKDSAVFLCDPHSGKIAMKLDGLKCGHIKGMVISEKFLVAVGTYAVATWNLVAGKIEWYHTLEHFGITKSELIFDGAFLAAQDRFISLAFNYSLPSSSSSSSSSSTPSHPLRTPKHHPKSRFLPPPPPKNPQSRILIFDMDSPIPSPLTALTLPLWLAALKPDASIGGGKGFILLDAKRHVHFLTPVATPRMLRPSAEDAAAARIELGLPAETEEGSLSAVYGGLLGEAKEEGEKMDVDEEELEEADESKVLPHEKIREAFEDREEGLVHVFERLCGLLGRRPLGDEEEGEVEMEDESEVESESESESDEDDDE